MHAPCSVTQKKIHNLVPLCSMVHALHWRLILSKWHKIYICLSLNAWNAQELNGQLFMANVVLYTVYPIKSAQCFVVLCFFVYYILPNLYYKLHQIPKPKYFSSQLAFVFAQSTEARWLGWELRCSWSSPDRRCSNYIWVINNFIAFYSVS